MRQGTPTMRQDGSGDKDAVGGAVSLVYDLNGNVLKTTDQNGHSSNYHYDVLGESFWQS